MQKVVIVDDNRMELATLEKKIDWENADCFLAGVATNGISGQEMIERLKPDIVISDIRMPGLDGLEMIEQVQEDLPDAIFIVLTGYEDFNYARTALRLRIFEYLLKPFKISEMESTLLRAVAESKRNYRARSLKEETEAIKYRQRIIDLIAGYSFPDDSFFNGCYKMYLYLGIGQETLPFDEMKATVEKNGNKFVHVCFIRDAQFIYIHHLIEGKKEDSLHPRIIECLERTKIGYVYEYTNQPVKSDRLFTEYQVMQKKLLFKRFSYLDYPTCSDPDNGAYTTDVQGLVKCIQEGNDRNVEHTLGGVLKGIAHNSENDILSVRIALYNLYMALARECKIPSKWTLKDIAGLEDLQSAYHLFLNMVKSVGSRDQGDIKKTSLLAYRIMQYIDDHFKEELRLSCVADAFYISPNHVSKVIRQTTGKSFTQYLNTIRIKYACELLSDPRIRVNEVASMAGYKDYSYFYQVFRRQQKMSPLEYRNHFISPM